MKLFDMANLDIQYEYVNGELSITGSYFGAVLRQDLRAEPPFIVLFDPETLNFEAVSLPKEYRGRNLVFGVEED